MVGIAILVAAGIISWTSAGNLCARDRLGNYWFGPSCRFQCHCLDRGPCNSTTGSCSSPLCGNGYFGSGCQYLSIAYKQPTTQSSTSSMSAFAVDGFTSTNSLTRSTLDPAWSVELQHPAWVVWVDVNVPTNYGTREIAMTTTNEGTAMPCNATNSWITSTTLRITCKNVVNATTITLVGTESTASRLALSEVYVFGGRNIALRGDTSQSSVFNKYNSSLAVDAGTSARFEDQSCTHTAVTSCSETGTTDPYWIVRLGQDYQMYRVDVYNRNAPNDVRLEDFRIRLGKAGVSGLKQVYQHRPGTPPEVTSVQMPVSRTANRLEVSLRGDCKILTLCEVQVFGDCLDYKYGLQCNFTCRCRDQAEVCNKVDGRCVSGCADGYTGVGCKEECPEGRYGFNCTKTCSNNCVDAHCYHVDGTCTCVPGWMGDQCAMECPEGRYGFNCTNSCNSNCVDANCHHVDGTCKCVPGWTGDKCTMESSENLAPGQDQQQREVTFLSGAPSVRAKRTYEHECRNKFSTCRNSICHPGNGTCIMGCHRDWSGTQCDTECPPGSFGQYCGMHCSNNCVRSLCDHVNGLCTCTLGWKGDNCDRPDADALRSSINPIVSGLAGSGITVVVVVAVAAAVLLVRRNRRRRQRTQEQVIYHDISDDIHPEVPGSQVNQTESRGNYDVLDVTSRDPDEGFGKTYTALNAIPQQRESMSREDYEVLDVTSRDADGGLEKTYRKLTTNTPYQNIPISGKEKSC